MSATGPRRGASGRVAELDSDLDSDSDSTSEEQEASLEDVRQATRDLAALSTNSSAKDARAELYKYLQDLEEKTLDDGEKLIDMHQVEEAVELASPNPAKAPLIAFSFSAEVANADEVIQKLDMETDAALEALREKEKTDTKQLSAAVAANTSGEWGVNASDSVSETGSEEEELDVKIARRRKRFEDVMSAQDAMRKELSMYVDELKTSNEVVVMPDSFSDIVTVMEGQATQRRWARDNDRSQKEEESEEGPSVIGDIPDWADVNKGFDEKPSVEVETFLTALREANAQEYDDATLQNERLKSVEVSLAHKQIKLSQKQEKKKVEREMEQIKKRVEHDNMLNHGRHFKQKDILKTGAGIGFRFSRHDQKKLDTIDRVLRSLNPAFDRNTKIHLSYSRQSKYKQPSSSPSSSSSSTALTIAGSTGDPAVSVVEHDPISLLVQAHTEDLSSARSLAGSEIQRLLKNPYQGTDGLSSVRCNGQAQQHALLRDADAAVQRMSGILAVKEKTEKKNISTLSSSSSSSSSSSVNSFAQPVKVRVRRNSASSSSSSSSSSVTRSATSASRERPQVSARRKQQQPPPAVDVIPTEPMTATNRPAALGPQANEFDMGDRFSQARQLIHATRDKFKTDSKWNADHATSQGVRDGLLATKSPPPARSRGPHDPPHGGAAPPAEAVHAIREKMKSTYGADWRAKNASSGSGAAAAAAKDKDKKSGRSKSTKSADQLLNDALRQSYTVNGEPHAATLTHKKKRPLNSRRSSHGKTTALTGSTFAVGDRVREDDGSSSRTRVAQSSSSSAAAPRASSSEGRRRRPVSGSGIRSRPEGLSVRSQRQGGGKSGQDAPAFILARRSSGGRRREREGRPSSQPNSQATT